MYFIKRKSGLGKVRIFTTLKKRIFNKLILMKVRICRADDAGKHKYVGDRYLKRSDVCP